MRRSSRIVAAAMLVLAVGCISLPDFSKQDIALTLRHVEEQADSILDYVEGKLDTLPGFDSLEPKKTSLLIQTIQFLSPTQTAYAAEEETVTSAQHIQELAFNMKQRYDEVQAIKMTGAVGENNRGLLQMERPNLITDPEERNSAQRVIAAENQDRRVLHQEIARLNRDQDLDVGQIERIYAQERLQRAKKGEYYELSPAGSDFDTFKTSALGQRLGEQCVPGAWITIK